MNHIETYYLLIISYLFGADRLKHLFLATMSPKRRNMPIRNPVATPTNTAATAPVVWCGVAWCGVVECGVVW